MVCVLHADRCAHYRAGEYVTFWQSLLLPVMAGIVGRGAELKHATQMSNANHAIATGTLLNDSPSLCQGT